MADSSSNFILGELDKIINDDKTLQYNFAVQIAGEEIKIPMKFSVPTFSDEKNNQVRANLEELRNKIISADIKFDWRNLGDPALLAFIVTLAVTLLLKYWGISLSLEVLLGIVAVLFFLLVVS